MTVAPTDLAGDVAGAIEMVRRTASAGSRTARARTQGGGFGPAPAAHPVHPASGTSVPPGEEPEFLAMDRRNDMVADASGVSLSVHGRTTDLAWHHIRFAQYRNDGQGSGYALTVSLTLMNGAQCVCRVGTRNMWEVEQWAGQLDAVLARFLPRH